MLEILDGKNHFLFSFHFSYITLHCNLNNYQWTGEDMSFCDLARATGFKVHANVDSTLIHHGSFGYKGKYGDGFKIKDEKKD